MTRKQFQALADALAHSRPTVPAVFQYGSASYWASRAKYVQWGEDIERVADVLALQNERFDRERFYRACGYDPETDLAAADDREQPERA